MMMTTTNDLPYRVALSSFFYKEPVKVREFLDRVPRLKELFASSPDELENKYQCNRELISQFQSHTTIEQAQHTIEQCDREGISIISISDELYPEALRAIPDAPSILYIQGDPAFLKRPAVAIVGSRKASSYGEMMTRAIVSDLCGRGLSIVSGLAYGIDAVAHQEAVKRGGVTIAVLAGGLRQISPKANLELAKKMTRNGCVISEFPLDLPPIGWRFLFRNRIISGLSLGTCVIEAAARSGSLSTARHALSQGREVFAVPGDVGRDTSAGTNALIREGALLVEKGEDIWNELSVAEPLLPNITALPDVTNSQPLSFQIDLTEEEQRIMQVLQKENSGIDSLVQATGLSGSQVMLSLTMLMSKGVVAAHPGQRYGCVI